MFKKGDFVSYSTTGVCEITDVIKMNTAGKEREYFVLKPVYQKGSAVYVPSDNEELVGKIRYAVDKKEIDEIILKAKEEPLCWIEDDNKRNEVFKEIIRSGDLYSLIRLVSCIYLQGEELSKTKHRLHSVDAITFSNAENILYNEFAFGLKINPNEVIEYIKEKME